MRSAASLTSKRASSSRLAPLVAAAAMVTLPQVLSGATNTETFTTSPATWQQLGQTIYGFSNTNNTGQESPAGEAGGVFDRHTIARGYGDIALGGKLTQAMPWSASG